MKRVFDEKAPELMDLDQPVSAELEKDLRNLISLNRHFGSHHLAKRFLAAWFQPGERYRVLDLATGAGDIPRLMVDWCRQREIPITVEAVDANPSTLAIAERQCPDYPEITWTRSDALTFDSPCTYDLVWSSLALHHFSEENAVRLLRRCDELSHHFVAVSDLERSLSTTIGVQLLTTLFYRDPMTRYDARLSAERAFSFHEMKSLAAAAGWKTFEHARFLFCRQALWKVKLPLDPISEVALPVPEVLPCPG